MSSLVDTILAEIEAREKWYGGNEGNAPAVRDRALRDEILQLRRDVMLLAHCVAVSCPPEDVSKSVVEIVRREVPEFWRTATNAATASTALLKTVEWNIYDTAKGHSPHIDNLDECVEAVLRASGFEGELDSWKVEAAGEALNDIREERRCELLNPDECVVEILETYRTAEAKPK